MQASQVSSKGQVVIPKPLRERLGIKDGTRVAFVQEGDSLRLTPLDRDAKASIKQGYGITGYRGPRVSLDEMREGVARKAKNFKIER